MCWGQLDNTGIRFQIIELPIGFEGGNHHEVEGEQREEDERYQGNMQRQELAEESSCPCLHDLLLADEAQLEVDDHHQDGEHEEGHGCPLADFTGL